MGRGDEMKFEIVDLCQEYAEAYVAMSKDFYSGDAVLTEVDEKNFYRTLELIESRSPYLRGVICSLMGKLPAMGCFPLPTAARRAGSWSGLRSSMCDRSFGARDWAPPI